jgi:hypothetical protein
MHLEMVEAAVSDDALPLEEIVPFVEGAVETSIRVGGSGRGQRADEGEADCESSSSSLLSSLRRGKFARRDTHCEIHAPEAGRPVVRMGDPRSGSEVAALRVAEALNRSLDSHLGASRINFASR